MIKNKIKQYALLSGNEEAEVYLMLIPVVAAIIIFIMAVLVIQSFFVPIFLIGVALLFIATQAIRAVIQSANTFMDVIFLPSHEEPSILD